MSQKFKGPLNLIEAGKKKNYCFLLSFLLPLLIILVTLIIKGVYPFGDRCILRTDFYHQYLPFYTELNYKLQNFKSLFYTYDVGLGTNFLTLFAYYLSSPFNILLLLVPRAFVLEFMTIMIVIKISLSGLAMAYYVSKRFDSNMFVVVLASLMYALSGYVAAYYWNIMWLDNIAIFPLLMLGFENVYNGKRPHLYVVTLSLSILCNYYIAAITCIFLVVYFVFYSVVINRKLKTVCKSFVEIGLYSIVVVLISSIILVPVILAFKTTASSGSSFPDNVKEYFTIIEALGRHLPFTKAENGIDNWPNLYSGVLCFPLVALYFLTKKYKIREKICYAVLLILFLASFSINSLDFIWHVFKYPNSLPCRQSFIYTFIVLTLCVKAMNKLKSIKFDKIILSFVASILLIIIYQKALETEKVPFYTVYLAIICLFIYLILFIKIKEKNKKSQSVLIITLCVFVALEAGINLYATSFLTIKRDDYMKNTKDIRKVLGDMKGITDDFYRVERVELKTKDDGAFLNFPSNSIFSSAAYKEGTDFYKQYGMEASTNAYSITGSTPFMDAFMSVKYKIFEKDVENPGALNIRKISSIENVSLYQNIDTLPLSFVIEDDFLEKYDKSSGNPATVQNNFSRALDLGTMLDKVNVDIDGKEAKLKITEEGDYYAFVRDKGIKEVTVSFDTTSEKYKNLNRGYFIELGYLKSDSKIEFRNDYNDSELLIEVFRFDYDTFKKVIKEINDNAGFNLRTMDDTFIKYDLNVNNAGTCLITLPYDKGFTIKVDGSVVEKEKVLDLFLGFKVSAGNHTIEISYMPTGFRIGVIFTIIGILSFAIITAHKRTQE